MTDQTAPATGARMWGVNLNPGIGKLNLLTFFLVCFTSIMLAAFVPQAQPFILSEIMQVPEGETGRLSGNLNFVGELVIIFSVTIWGVLSDRIGRLPVTVMGYILIAGSMGVYAVSDSFYDLLIARIVYSLGIAAVSTMLITLMADYATENSRGKATGLLGVFNGLGAMVTVFVLLKLPAMFTDGGATATEASFNTYMIVGGVVLATAILMFLGLKGGRPEHREFDIGMAQQISEGITAAKDLGIRLAYAASFVARGNLAVVGTFFVLWTTNYGVNELGMEGAEALKKGGMVVAISYTASLLSAPIFGIMTDRMNRVSALAVTLAIGAVGYCAMIFVDDPFSGVVYPCMILIGMAEVGCIITSGVLISQQAPKAQRGSVIGIFTLSGAVGILIASIVGGYLFDGWHESGPFVLFGIFAAIVLVWALMSRDKVVPLNEDATAAH